MIGYMPIMCASIDKIINIVKNYQAKCYKMVTQINVLEIKMYDVFI